MSFRSECREISYWIIPEQEKQQMKSNAKQQVVTAGVSGEPSHGIGSFRRAIDEMIGHCPQETGFKAKMRRHQGWWRAFVLGVPPGPHPINGEIGEAICNVIPPESGRDGFLNADIRKVVGEVLKEWKTRKTGIIEETRLQYNLLSSQPLCFNFFAPLHRDPSLALGVLRNFFPQLTTVTRVIFEFAPEQRYTADNSAFDVAIECMEGNKRVLIGLECKYTDSFSTKRYSKKEYEAIFSAGKGWIAKYPEYIEPRFNQLFRNQLIAESLVQHRHYDKVYTGLFCSEADKPALDIAAAFQSMLKNGTDRFRIITQRDFITSVQRLDVPWDVREWSMMLWARYNSEISSILHK